MKKTLETFFILLNTLSNKNDENLADDSVLVIFLECVPLFVGSPVAEVFLAFLPTSLRSLLVGIVALGETIAPGCFRHLGNKLENFIFESFAQ